MCADPAARTPMDMKGNFGPSKVHTSVCPFVRTFVLEELEELKKLENLETVNELEELEKLEELEELEEL